VTVLIDEKDEVIYRKRLPNDLSVILEQLSPYQSWLNRGRNKSPSGSNR